MRYITLRDGRRYNFDRMKIMGIINATYDSFYKDSRVVDLEDAIAKVKKMIEEGADIIDVGGESTRPGADPVSTEEEIRRVIPLIREIKKINSSILISVDTYRAKTAEEAIRAGADIINDISAMEFDENMAEVVREYKVPVILMHIKGTPKNMQDNPEYKDVVKEVKDYFEERVNYAVSKDIDLNKIILDPGIGFGKKFEHNIELIKNIEKLRVYNLPMLLAVSRKSSIGIALGNLPPEERLEGTIAVTCFAALKGVEMVRVHDVKENKRAALMIEVLK
ncbi:dihydropteroate synthase [Fonticella tunisiensis]|uniref:Dihydropteroate synthase n=1 Tax=Fonticella tunisiensis TaxID=1096341 RepID=A0A4R7KBI8_9CLOT|nr:dihydropteroate synthase [Fonticella tunisiensis]TDT51348.1 dihydropteroate synthase [Fonticella tunisiensis]